MKPSILSGILAVATLAYADISFTSPAAGAKLVGGGSLSVRWTDSGSPVFTTYTLTLCAGGNTDGTWMPLVEMVTGGSFAVGAQAEGVVPGSIGASTPANAYFLKLVATGATGTVTYFSSRFSFSGMTGTFTPVVLTGAQSVTGTDGPATIKNIAPINPGEPQFNIPFNDQIGLTRYAPMQSVPPTKITKKTKTPLYSASSITGYAKKALPPASIQTTITQAQTFQVQSRENTAAPAPMPSDDMAKFLNRWKD